MEDRLQLDRAEIKDAARLEYDYVRDAAKSMSWLLENHEGPADEDLDALEDDPFDPTSLPPQLPYIRPVAKIGRNDPCPCGSGSGKKYKKCHLDIDPFARG